MMVEKFTLELHEGTPCVAYSTTDYSKPLVVTHYWPLSREKRHKASWEALGYVFGTILESVSMGSGLFRDRAGWSWQKKNYDLIDGSTTKSIHRTSEDAVRPKGMRKDAAWEDGRWVRRLQRGRITNYLPAQFFAKGSR